MNRHCREWMIMVATCILAAEVPIRVHAQSVMFQTDSDPVPQVDFERHVAPLLLKHGCNAGACHGAAEGQAGFRLSLFGQDPQFDFESITSTESQRIDCNNAEQSLLLQKSTALIDHGGGERIQTNSTAHHLLLKWIEQGVQNSPGSGRLASLEVVPAKILLTEDHHSTIIQVVATYANGDRADVTELSDLHVNDDAIASLQSRLLVRGNSTGDTIIVASYAGRPASARILVPASGPVRIKTDAGQENSASIVDRHINAQLAELNVEPSPACSDEIFLRRLTLTTIGQLPSPHQVREFVADKTPDKRRRTIESHLQNPLHAAMWATRMCEITGSRDTTAADLDESSRREQKWHAWFRARFEQNMRYDELVSAILTATTRDGKSADEFLASSIESAGQNVLNDESRFATRESLDIFWQRPTVNEAVATESIAERIAAAFMGVRIECSRCHKHPFDRWSQSDHHAFVNAFSQVRYGLSADFRIALSDKLQQQRELAEKGLPTTRVPAVREIFVTDHPHNMRDPRSKSVLPPRPLGGEVLGTANDRREEFASWLVNNDNRFFARNFVNRVWSVYFGRGFVEPVDAFSAANPPTHPELLDELAALFSGGGYDLRALEATILNSEAWQRSPLATESNRDDSRNYSRFTLRIISADVLVDAISCTIGDVAARAVEEPKFSSTNEDAQAYFGVFSRPERKLTCDCERSGEPTLRQSMLLLSDAKLCARIADMTAALTRNAESPVDEIVNDLFLRSLSRWPTNDEKYAALQHIVDSKNQEQGLADVLWSLMNTREFVTVH